MYMIHTMRLLDQLRERFILFTLTIVILLIVICVLAGALISANIEIESLKDTIELMTSTSK